MVHDLNISSSSKYIYRTLGMLLRLSLYCRMDMRRTAFSDFEMLVHCTMCVLTVQFVHNRTSGLLVILTHWKVANLCKIKCKVNKQLLIF